VPLLAAGSVSRSQPAAARLPAEGREADGGAGPLAGCFPSRFVGRRPSGIPEEDVRSSLVPYLLKHRAYLRKILREKEEENRKVAESVLAGRDRIAELQRLIQARKRAWQVKIKTQIQIPSFHSVGLKETLLCGAGLRRV